jgi:hypothetical protein
MLRLTIICKKIIENIATNFPGLYNLYCKRETTVSHRVNSRSMCSAIWVNCIDVTDVALM